MSAGTLTLTNNSATVTGSGTAFATELAVGGFIVATVGGTPYTLGIQAIGSDTSLTLTMAYDGPTTSGVAFDYVPLATLNLITSALASQVSYAIRGLNLDKNNWQSIFDTTISNTTVNLPDGSSFSGPTWGGITTTLNGKAAKGANSDITSLTGLTTALSVSQGGTGATTAAAARSNLGLGTAATKNYAVGVVGDVMLQSYYGFGVIQSTSGYYGSDGGATCFYGGDSTSSFLPQAGSGIVCGYVSTRRQQIFTGTSGNLFVRNLAENSYSTSSSTIAWNQLQNASTSDINFKNIIGDLDLEESLANINAMEFKKFTYKDDETAAERRGVVAQQIETIDPEYVHSAEGVGKMTLDMSPLLMDALAAIKALSAKVNALTAEVADLKGAGS